MDIENALKKSLDDNTQESSYAFLESLSNQRLYFFFNEKNKVKTPKNTDDNVVEVVFVSKENPINVPIIISNEYGRNGELYTNQELAKKSAEFSCKIAKMEANKAFKFFYDLADIDGVYLQGNSGYILLKRENIKRLINK